MRQAVGEVQFARLLLCVKLLGDSRFRDHVLRQAVGRLQFPGSCFASSYSEITVSEASAVGLVVISVVLCFFLSFLVYFVMSFFSWSLRGVLFDISVFVIFLYLPFSIFVNLSVSFVFHCLLS